MPEPVPSPTPEELVIVSEITMLTIDEVSEMVAADSDQDVSNVKWSRTQDDIERWPDIRDEAGDLKKLGTLEFFGGVSVETRLDFRNLIRSRYGQTLLTSDRETEVLDSLEVSSLAWF